MDTDKLVFGIIGGITILVTAIIIITSFTTASSADLKPEELIGNEPHRQGSESAKLTIVEFSDFECPFCAQYSPILSSLLDQYPNDLAIVYRHYPLPMHTGAIPAARASEAANNQGKFWEYHDKLFTNQPNFAQADLEKYAQEIGLDMDKFKSDLNAADTANKVQEDADYGRKLGISGTPTFYAIYDGKAEAVTLQQYSDIEEKVKSILGDSLQQDYSSNADQSNSSGGPTVGTQIPADMPANIPMNVTLDIINVQRKDSVAPSEVSINTVTKEQWPSSDLGCPKEGQMYTQVVTPGYKVLAEAKGEVFEYHTDESANNVVFCSAKAK